MNFLANPLINNANEVFSLIKACIILLTACGVFVVGIHLLSKGFVELSFLKENAFTRLFKSDNRFKSIFAGAIHSGVTQSSDATSVMAIKFLNAGTITLFQTCCIIIGANIGTTVTSFLVSLSEFDVTVYLSFLVFVGSFPLLVGKGKAKIFGEILSGFGILFLGIQLLELSALDPTILNAFNELTTIFNNKFILFGIALAITAVIQSSSVMTALIIFAIGATVMPLESGFYMVIGANIGTCITSFIASSKLSKNAKRAALFRLLFNIIGAAIFITLLIVERDPIMDFCVKLGIPGRFKIAIFNLAFNLITAIIVLPFIRPLVALTRKIIKYKTEVKVCTYC